MEPRGNNFDAREELPKEKERAKGESQGLSDKGFNRRFLDSPRRRFFG